MSRIVSDIVAGVGALRSSSKPSKSMIFRKFDQMYTYCTVHYLKSYMVASREFGAYIKVNVNSETPTVPGHSRLSPTVPDCPKCVPRSCVTFISKNNRCGPLLKARDTSGETSTIWLSHGISRKQRGRDRCPVGKCQNTGTCVLEIPCDSWVVGGRAGSVRAFRSVPHRLFLLINVTHDLGTRLGQSGTVRDSRE